MLEKKKQYMSVKFPPQIVRQAFRVFKECAGKFKNIKPRLEIDYGDESWKFESEDEFSSEYRKDIRSAYFIYNSYKVDFEFWFFSGDYSVLTVSLGTKEHIEKVFEVLEQNYEKYRIPEEDQRKAIQKRVTVFIGHGRNKQWRELKEHLEEKHDFKVIAYETGVRAGRDIWEVLEKMSQEASIAFLLHTGENLGKDGVWHARDNVIHETGLFQVKLGLKRSIVLREEDCIGFSNISGIQEVRFPKDKIKEIFGDVVSIIYEQFGTK